ncbi:hypothetical protein [Haloarcula amylolytica]|uniref:hypothetical protein n=1 Tax=Haloarcula amylolytica TaxID=396317 RepID=UPI003C770143
MVPSSIYRLCVYIWAYNRDYCEPNLADNDSLDDTDYNHIDFGKREIRIKSAKANAGDESSIRYVYYYELPDARVG